VLVQNAVTTTPVSQIEPNGNVLMAAAEFERELIHERSVLGRKRYLAQYEPGKVGKEVHSKSGKDLRVGRPKRVFARIGYRNCGREATATDRLPGS